MFLSIHFPVLLSTERVLTLDSEDVFSSLGSSQLQFSSVQLLSRVWLFATSWIAACQASLSITTPRVYPNSCPLSWWRHPTISSSVFPFSSCPQSFSAWEAFQMSLLFTSSGPSIRVSASTSVLPMNTQDWSPLGWTSWISLQSKGLSRGFSNTTVQKHQFFLAYTGLMASKVWLLLSSID